MLGFMVADEHLHEDVKGLPGNQHCWLWHVRLLAGLSRDDLEGIFKVAKMRGNLGKDELDVALLAARKGPSLSQIALH